MRSYNRSCKSRGHGRTREGKEEGVSVGTEVANSHREVGRDREEKGGYLFVALPASSFIPLVPSLLA